MLEGKEIICTLGPASMNKRVIVRFEELGVSLLRINLSHTKLKDVAASICFIQDVTSIPICLDTEGAQIRTGALQNGMVFLQENSIVRIPRSSVLGDFVNFNFYPRNIIDKLNVGDFINIDFNSVLAQIIAKEPGCVIMRILTAGLVRQNKSVAVERDITMPPLTKKDRKALSIGAEMGVGFVAASFVNQGTDINEIRAISKKKMFVISKIESLKGVINLEEIAAKSDALLLDRGDLSHQVPIEQIPRIQKDIIRRAKKLGKKIYVATNLLESMITSLTPTRAEVNDVFNTLSDGADGLVLAAETAIGNYPINCVTMVSKITRQFLNFSDKYSHGTLQRKDYFSLVEPHGNILVNRTNYDFNGKKIKGYKVLKVDETVLIDAEQIALGTYSPLEGFMNKKDLDSVLRNYCLSSGLIWPLPIMLQVTDKQASGLKTGTDIALVLENSDTVYAILHLEDIYTYDLQKIALETFGTNRSAHPGVSLLKRRGGCFLGGKIELIKRLPSAHKQFELTPREVRLVFENKGWSKIAAFHTRNVIHRAHEYIQMYVLARHHCDGLFVHPAVGSKKKGDYNAGVILKSYEFMINKYYPKGKVFLSTFQNYSRYAGPREAVFTALCRKNFGCSHFIVGRDHTGLGNFYHPQASQKIFDKLPNLGIEIIKVDEVFYSKKSKKYFFRKDYPKDENNKRVSINGTLARAKLQRGLKPPSWLIRPEISKFILEAIKRKKEVFLISDFSSKQTI